MDNKIKEKLFTAFPVFRQHREKLMPLIRIRNIPPKTILLHEGEISGNLYIVISGCLRLYYIKNDGSDFTSQFFFENQLVSSIESFIKKIPSRMFLETLEESAVCVISARSMTTILGLHEDFNKWYFAYLKERLIYYTRLHSSFILDSPEERYLKLVDEYPFILQRLPQYYIASYLGITPVSLSRIRARIKKREINKG